MVNIYVLKLIILFSLNNQKHTLKVVEVHEGPIIKKGDLGTEGNKYGFEGGRAFKYKGNIIFLHRSVLMTQIL